MPLARCQLDAYQTTLDARVLRVESAGETWRAVLDDTVLYPEGGGQPADRGSIAGVPVLRVDRIDGELVHTLSGPVEAGSARVELDWERRYDHMQQHTAQHLLTAVIQDRFGFPTISFHLGADSCSIDLDAPGLSPEQLAAISAAANAEIRAARPVRYRLVDADDLDDVRTRGLPEGFSGAVRLVEIEGVDLNTCGGTHLANTAEIQAIALPKVEKITRGVRLYYLAGGRLLRAVADARAREGAVTRLLTCPPSQHAAAVEKLQASAKQSRRERKALLAELAGMLGRSLAAGGSPAALHRDDADMAFLSAVASAARQVDPGLTMLLTAGVREGVFLALGDPSTLNAARGELLAALEGRGGGPPGRIQGKAKRLDRRDQALALLA